MHYDIDRPEIEPEINVVAVDNGKAIYNGELLESRDVDGEIEAMINEALKTIESNMASH